MTFKLSLECPSLKELIADLLKKGENLVAPTNDQNVEGTNMRQSVFNVMVSGERGDVATIEYIKEEMQEKDAIGKYPYKITTDMWIYQIFKPSEPYFTMYGTQYSANQKHK